MELLIYQLTFAAILKKTLYNLKHALNFFN